MSFTQRIEIHPFTYASKNKTIKDAKKYLDMDIEGIYEVKTYWLHSQNDLTSITNSLCHEEVLHDSVIEQIFIQDHHIELEYDSVLEIKFKPGVTDNAAHSTLDAIRLVSQENKDLQVFTGKIYFIKGDLAQEQITKMSAELLGNSLLNTFEVYTKEQFNESRFQHQQLPIVKMQTQDITHYNIHKSEQERLKDSVKNCWALSKSELQQIQDHFNTVETKTQRTQYGLNELPTDVEMEIIAQSWSEHCKHKIFAANINYSEKGSVSGKKLGTKKVESLYKSYIKKATKDINEKRNLNWLISVFSDNAGIVRFDDNLDLCIKVETHNSPSALDPYGGALTGILGVNRDILGCGIGAKPIANTDVFCFAHESLLENGVKLPSGLKHPKRILEGVHKGVEDGGNKSGIPTVNGSIFFDDDYAGKPLVFVGTVGAMPQRTQHYESSAMKNQKAGDKVVMVGGRIGADGIHGATFSSLELNEDSPATAVQIGDPLTQKKVMDFMLKARDLGLYSSVTDNGAGGLSSSIGEMAEATNGVKIDLKLAPTKYPGLSPYELMISESQERMSFAVPCEKINDFQKLASEYNVESTVLGEFTNSGNFEVYYGDQLVALLDLHFLHESLRPMELKAEFDPSLSTTNPNYWHGKDLREEATENIEHIITTLLQRPNIASKEDLVRHYDHEVQAATVVKPFTGVETDGPSDAGVIWLAPHGGQENNAIVISNGMQPLFSHQDGYTMAIASVDEAVRNAISTGANPEKIVLLDNFCWPDPLVGPNNPDYAHKMAQLVRSCEGLYDIATYYGMPFVSGKDSMKNDYSGINDQGEKVKISVPPTLLVTAMGQIENVEKVITTDFKQSGDLIYLVGQTKENKLTFSEYTRAFTEEYVDSIHIDYKTNFEIYKAIYNANQLNLIQSSHDISEGGAITAVIESSIGAKLGAIINIESKALLFNEGSGQFILSVKKENTIEFEKQFKNLPFKQIGLVIENYELQIKNKTMNLNKLEAAWKNTLEQRYE
jgi:phosphoribosylformylglycinamidine synthase II